MPRILLRLLLCLCLVANAATGAWASVGMAMPGAPQAAATAMPCHDGMPAAATDHAMHGQDQDQPGPHHGLAGCKAGDCQCLQHCNAALAMPAALPAPAFGATSPNWTPHTGRGDPSPYRPVRPPIA